MIRNRDAPSLRRELVGKDVGCLPSAFNKVGLLHRLERLFPVGLGLPTERLALRVGRLQEVLVELKVPLQHDSVELGIRALLDDRVDALVDMAVVDVLPRADLNL